ncbi:MAG: Phosphate-binding protein PstS 1 precursor [Firmicutes bacterium ADurb.Bin419]|nr:MAG: Phosphate-binding protein PstS 1 precursor [Firmicutes bacterium ADurb.Bin419]
MNNIGARILIAVVLIGGLSYFGFISIIVASLMGEGKFYVPFCLTVTLGLIIFVMVGASIAPKLKKLLIVFGVFLLICTVTVVTYEVNRNYHKSIPVVNEQGVDLNAYRPFEENTLAVKLNEKSTLKIESDIPTIDGATALYPLYSAFAQATFPEKEYEVYDSEVQCNTTTRAYDNLFSGMVDIIFVAQPSKEQMEIAKASNLELQLTPIGKEAFVFFVNSNNPVSEITTEQIQSIYSGKITNWKEVGGKNEKIRAFQRPDNSGSQTMLQKLMDGKNLMTPPKEDVVKTMGGIIEQTASYRNYKNAIGYSFLFFATQMVKDDKIKLLTVDGVYPDRDTIKSEKYPLSTDIYAVTVGKNRSPNVERLIEWILSPQGQYIVEKTGYTPLN